MMKLKWFKNKNTLAGFGQQWSVAVVCLQLTEKPVSLTSLQNMSLGSLRLSWRLYVQVFPSGGKTFLYNTHAHRVSPSQVPADCHPYTSAIAHQVSSRPAFFIRDQKMAALPMAIKQSHRIALKYACIPAPEISPAYSSLMKGWTKNRERYLYLLFDFSF